MTGRPLSGRVVDATPDEARRRRATDQLDTLAWLLDNSIPIPGVGRIGLDAVIGLVPLVGDMASGAIGLLVIMRGVQLRVPRIVIVRMTLNAALDFVVGAIPIIGDLFDAWFKATTRNVALLRRHVAEPEADTRESWAAVAVIGLAVVAALVALVLLAVWLVSALAGALSL